MPSIPTRLVELHLHLEGCLGPRLAAEFAAERPGLGPPPKGSVHGERWRFDDLMGFLRLFGWGARLLDGPGPYRRLLDECLGFLDGQGVVYAELQVAIGVMHHFGTDPHQVLPALASRAAEHEACGGVRVQFIADGVRQFGVEKSERVLEDALALREHRIVGFGLGGDERAIEASAFHEIYARARAEGLGTCLHAGEGTTPRAVADALELGVDRIGHGISAVSDAALLARLRETGTVLEVCPGSNRRTGAWPASSGPHPLARLLEAGVPVVLGSDDPAFFETGLRAEFEDCAAQGISDARLVELNARAASSAFLPPQAREALARSLC